MVRERRDERTRRARRARHYHHYYMVAATLAGTVSAAIPVTAQTAPAPQRWQDQITLSVSDRVRGEFIDWFEPAPDKAPHDAHRYDFFANQLRVGGRVEAPHSLLAVEVQDTQFVNLPNDASAPPSKVGNLGPGAIYFANTHQRDQGEVFLKQAYLTLRNPSGAAGLSFTGGRFEYSDGLETIPADPALAWLKRARIGERLVGPFGYTHVTRSFDGGRAVYDTEDFNITAMGTVPTQGGFEVSANRELDAYLAGIAATLKQLPNAAPLDARLFYLYYEDQRREAVKVDNRTAAAKQSDRDTIAIHTWGAHAITVVDAGPGKVDGLLWGALQAGDWGVLDHFGWAYAAEAGYQLPQLPAAPWLRGGYDRSSGDGDPNDKSHKTFFQILPTARIYAQTPFFNMMNTGDLFAQLILKPHSRVTVRTDYHWLQLTDPKDLWYSGGGATSNQFFGFAGLNSGGQRELAHFVDTSATISLLKQLTAYVYYGHAFGQGVVRSSFAGTGANYGYVETTFRY